MTEDINVDAVLQILKRVLAENLDAHCNGPGVVQRKDRQKKEFHDQSDYR